MWVKGFMKGCEINLCRNGKLPMRRLISSTEYETRGGVLFVNAELCELRKWEVGCGLALGHGNPLWGDNDIRGDKDDHA